MKITLDITVMAFETDFYGIVSNTRYLEYLERGRYVLMHRAGLTVREIWDEIGVQPIVRSAEIQYLGFARHEDNLQLHTWIEAQSGATTTICHKIVRVDDGGIVIRATQTLAYINKKDRPVRVPEVYRNIFVVEPEEN